MDSFLSVANFIVGVITLGVLFWYAWLTMMLKDAATNQVEAMAKPCLTLWAKLRGFDDTVLEMNGAAGAMVVQADVDTNLVVQNMGTGVALNVTYRFEDLDIPITERDRGEGYLVYILPTGKVSMPAPINARPFSGNCQIVFTFESIGGRRYQSTVTLNSHVLTAFQFEKV
jgi:hypothetical protein